jgi:DinB family protein
VRSPDPVSEPQAYQQHLLGLLREDDPAEVQSGTPDVIAGLVLEAGDDLRTRPEPSEWSVYGCIGHMVDAEIVASARYRWIVAHDEPPLVGYDQDLWADTLHAGEEPVEELQSLFSALRTANLLMWARSTPDQRARVGIHAERGPESYDLTFRLIAGHDRFHVAQARRALDRVRA